MGATFIANARMYSVNPAVGALWQRLFTAIAARTALPIAVIEHREPEPISALWRREDNAAVFMCGLPYSLSGPRPTIVAAPVPSPPAFAGEPVYWSEWIVRADSRYTALTDTFGARLALTTPESQSGCAAALQYLMGAVRTTPLYAEVVAPQITPQGAMRAVVEDRADVAPIDSFAFALLEKHEPELTRRVRVVARTLRNPIPPLVASHAGLESLTAAFIQAHDHADTRKVMSELLIERFVLPDPASYDVLRQRFEAATRFWREHPLATVVDPAFAALTSSAH
jgi:ABC-type phosphate/phosphonate transport system substrate-binding protein